MRSKELPAGSQVFHRDQSKSVLQLLPLFALCLALIFLCDTIFARVLGGGGFLALGYVLVTVPR